MLLRSVCRWFWFLVCPGELGAFVVRSHGVLAMGMAHVWLHQVFRRCGWFRPWLISPCVVRLGEFRGLWLWWWRFPSVPCWRVCLCRSMAGLLGVCCSGCGMLEVDLFLWLVAASGWAAAWGLVAGVSGCAVGRLIRDGEPVPVFVAPQG